jgi:hypothetical protein
MAAALEARKVDAAYLPEPFIAGAQESIGRRDDRQSRTGRRAGSPISGYIVTQSREGRYPKAAAVPSGGHDSLRGVPGGTVQIAAEPAFPLHMPRSSSSVQPT